MCLSQSKLLNFVFHFENRVNRCGEEGSRKGRGGAEQATDIVIVNEIVSFISIKTL